MSGATIGVWCTVSPGEARLLRHTMRNLVDHPSVARLLVVHTGARPPAEYGDLARACPDRVVELHRDFGEGLDRPVEAGGYDQCAARNYALDQVDGFRTDWLLQFDADEVFTNALISRVAHLPDRYDAVCTSYFTLLPGGRYWHVPRHDRRLPSGPIHHPHILIWRRSLQRRVELCPTSSRREANITRHASVPFAHHPPFKVKREDGWDHFHLHCLLGKEHAAVRTRGRPHRAPLPHEVRACIQALTPEPVHVG